MPHSSACPSLSFGPQEPPQDYRIFNKRQPDGTYRPLSEFFNAPFEGRDETVEAPFAFDAPIVPEDAHSLDFPNAIDSLEHGCVVKVQLPYKREFFGNVVTVDAVEEKVLVEAWNAAIPTAWYDADVVQLVWTREAAAIAMERETAATR